MSGWIKDYRREVESDIWLMPPMYHRVWQWIKYSVNHKQAKIPNKDGSFTNIKPGQRATSYRQIAKGVGYYEGLKWKEPNVKTIKSILDWMVKQNMIEIQGNTLGTILTVANWEVYQLEEVQGNTKRIAMETPSKHDLDTNKNEEECLKNEKKNKHAFIFDYWQEHAPHKHKSLSDTISKELNKLTKIQADEVIVAIGRYVKANNDPNYFYNQTWVLNNFIKQSNGYKSWLDEGNNWVKYDDNKKPIKQTLLGAESSNTLGKRKVGGLSGK